MSERWRVPVGCGRWLWEVADPLWLQVSAFGGNEQSDSGDVWAVQWEKGPTQWQKDQKVSLGPKNCAACAFVEHFVG